MATGWPEMSRRLAAEFLGTALLLVAVVGSGIMAERLSGGNAALALLANSIWFKLMDILNPQRRRAITAAKPEGIGGTASAPRGAGNTEAQTVDVRKQEARGPEK